MKQMLVSVILWAPVALAISGESEFVFLEKSNVFCQRASNTFFSSDQQACGPATRCDTPVMCRWGKGGETIGMVSCRATKVTSLSGGKAEMACPKELQKCADDEHVDVQIASTSLEVGGGASRTIHAPIGGALQHKGPRR